MKSTGLSSKVRKGLRHTTKAATFAAHQEGHLAAKERQKSLRAQAERVQLAKQQKEEQVSSKNSDTNS